MKITRLLIARIIFGILFAVSVYIIVRDFQVITSSSEEDQIPMLLTIPIIWVNAILWLEPQAASEWLRL